MFLHCFQMEGLRHTELVGQLSDSVWRLRKVLDQRTNLDSFREEWIMSFYRKN